MSRMLEGHLPTVPVLSDVESLDGKPWLGAIDGITAGFPCQATLWWFDAIINFNSLLSQTCLFCQ